MEPFDPSPLIQASEKLTDIFGYWPSFHDAEVQTFSLSGGESEPWVPGCNTPMLDTNIHLWELTKAVDPKGYFVLAKHTLAHLRFESVESLELKGFRFQNQLWGLVFTVPSERVWADGNKHPVIQVEFEASAGLWAKFTCMHAIVISAVPCDDRGRVLEA